MYVRANKLIFPILGRFDTDLFFQRIQYDSFFHKGLVREMNLFFGVEWLDVIG